MRIHLAPQTKARRRDPRPSCPFVERAASRQVLEDAAKGFVDSDPVLDLPSFEHGCGVMGAACPLGRSDADPWSPDGPSNPSVFEPPGRC